jgi:hypothetical protein
MRVAPETVAMNGEQYRQHIELMRHQREVLRCLLALDIPGIRKVWKEMAPHLDQPESDWDALRAMHEARVRMLRISPQQKRYSEHWLRELESKTRIAAAVGIAVKAFKSENTERARDVQAAQVEAVLVAVKDGVDIEAEVPEIHRRMKLARQKIYGS